MKTLLLILIALSTLAACGDNDSPEVVCTEPEPDDVISVVYPCNLQHEACQAARQAAEARCDRKAELAMCRDQCPVLSPSPRYVECVAHEMTAICYRYTIVTGGATCNGEYDTPRELAECLDTYRSATCVDPTSACEI